MAGSWAAFSHANCYRYTGECWTIGVTLADLRRPPKAHYLCQVDEDALVTDMELRANGRLAWIQGVGQTFEVWRRTPRGLQRLDRGPDIDRYSLDRVGTTISWTHGAERRSARLV